MKSKQVKLRFLRIVKISLSLLFTSIFLHQIVFVETIFSSTLSSNTKIAFLGLEKRFLCSKLSFSSKFQKTFQKDSLPRRYIYTSFQQQSFCVHFQRGNRLQQSSPSFKSRSIKMSTSVSNSAYLPSPLFFGPFEINKNQVFYHSEHVVGIVNLKPLVPGHVLIIPKRIVGRVADLNSPELQDLFATVQIVGPKLEEHFNATALNIAIQDGKAAGQSVPHVHVHILPRKLGDYERNDDIYEDLEKQELSKEWVKDEDRRPRTSEEMTEEAQLFYSLFQGTSLPI